MDASELLAPDPGLSTTTIILIVVAVFGGVLAIAGKIVDVRRPDLMAMANWTIIPGMILLALGFLGGAVSAHAAQPDRGGMLESVLFEGYGFTVEHPAHLWNSISGEGDTGTATELSREGVEQDVRIHLDGTLLVITGPDGKEIPTNAQRVSESGS